jgi:hypothetical protein
MLRCLGILLLLPALVACQSDKADGPAAKGSCMPTCAGGAQAPGFNSLKVGREAFTRMSPDGVVTATLEDALWLRFEGDPATVQKAHRAYFDYGYTTFQVILRAKEFTQPTTEAFVLEDSSGARIAGKPLTYQGNLKPVGDRWQYAFNLSFDHTISKQVRWLRLTRLRDGESVEWSFPEAP